jgi:LEA14-like dessication related protein
MSSASWRHLLWSLALSSCTPLGLWLYEDPVITVSHITLQFGRGGTPQSPVQVTLDVKNANDYPLSTEKVELSLRLDGIPIGTLSRDSTIDLATDTVSSMALPLAPTQRTSPTQLRSLSSGTHRFAVRGRATFRTPIGIRKVRFAQEGSLIFRTRPQVSPGS